MEISGWRSSAIRTGSSTIMIRVPFSLTMSFCRRFGTMQIVVRRVRIRIRRRLVCCLMLTNPPRLRKTDSKEHVSALTARAPSCPLSWKRQTYKNYKDIDRLNPPNSTHNSTPQSTTSFQNPSNPTFINQLITPKTRNKRNLERESSNNFDRNRGTCFIGVFPLIWLKSGLKLWITRLQMGIMSRRMSKKSLYPRLSRNPHIKEHTFSGSYKRTVPSTPTKVLSLEI